jgi:hypothetical protein
MTGSVKVSNEKSLGEFIDRVRGLHDALLHEAVLLHPGYVDKVTQEMWDDAVLPSARLIFQSQLNDVLAVQVDLRKVSRFEFNPRRELELEGEIRNGEVILYLTAREESDFCEIRAAEMEYRILGREFLGSEYKLVESSTPDGILPGRDEI